MYIPKLGKIAYVSPRQRTSDQIPFSFPYTFIPGSYPFL